MIASKSPHRGSRFVATIDVLNALPVFYLAFEVLPWDIGTNLQGLSMLGLAAGVLLGAARWSVDMRTESIAPALVLASVVGVVPTVWKLAARPVEAAALGWAVIAVGGLMVVVLALAAAHRMSERRATPTR